MNTDQELAVLIGRTLATRQMGATGEPWIDLDRRHPHLFYRVKGGGLLVVLCTVMDPPGGLDRLIVDETFTQTATRLAARPEGVARLVSRALTTDTSIRYMAVVAVAGPDGAVASVQSAELQNR